MTQPSNILTDEQVGIGAAPAAVEASSAPVKALTDADVGIEAPSRGFKGWARDVAATAVKGAIGVPEAIVGLADIPTGGRVGKFLENEGGSLGFRPKEAKELVNDWHSDATKEAQRKFQEADGIGGKFMAAVENPSNIVTAVGESLPSMGLGGVAARGLMTATKLGQMGAKGAALAGAAGEGVTMAGSAAEQIRQETPDGLLTPGQSALAGATGLVGGALGAIGGRVAQKLGIGDVDTMIAQGGKGMADEAGSAAARAAANPLVQQQAMKGIPRRVIEGAISEGFLEELPQSMAEQIFQNVALGKDWLQDVDAAAVMGVLSGGLMGGAASGYHGMRQQQPNPQPQTLPPEGEQAQAPAAEPVSPGMERMRQAMADQLAALQQQEQGEPAVPQTTPPDGAAVLAQQQAADAARRQAAQDASRAVAEPDDEIYQSTGMLSQMAGASAAPASRGAQSLVDVLDTDAVYQGWSNVQDGSDRSVMRDQMAYVERTYAGKVGPDNRAAAEQELAQQFKWFRAATPEQRAITMDRLSVPMHVKPSEAMGIDPAAGPLSAGAAMAVDTGVSGQMQEAAAQAQAAERAAKESKKPAADDQKQERQTQAQQALDPETGEILQENSMAAWSDGDLSSAFRGAQSRDVRMQLARELSRRRAEREQQALQAELDAEQAGTVPGAERADAAFASLNEDAGPVPAELSIPATTQGVTDGPQASQAQQDRAQPAQVGATPAVAGAAPDVQGSAGAQGAVATTGVADGRPSTANPGAQGTPATGAQAQAQSGKTEALRQQLRDVEAKILKAAPEALGQGGGDIEAAMKSRKVPVTLKAQRKKLASQIQAAHADEVQTFAPETGTLGIPRADMPQVPAQSHGGLVKHLNAQGIAHETTTVNAADLKPTQAEYSPAKVEAAKTATGDRAVIVSSDGHVIDGHHQAMAAAEDDKPVKAIVLDAPVEQALEAVKKSPSAQGATQDAPPAAAAPAVKKPRGVLAKKAEAEAKARADYFTPGNIVKSYGGHDRVVSYTPPDANGRWSVTVRAVRVQDGKVVDAPNVRERTHATPPDARELKAGPVVLAAPTQQAESMQGAIAGSARSEQVASPPATSINAPETIAADANAQSAGSQNASNSQAVQQQERPTASGSRQNEKQKPTATFTEKAQEAIESGANSAVPRAPRSAAPRSTPAPIEDAGEKIGGARKDRWKERGLNLDDLDAMTEAEGAELATKANVWKPDYEALSAAAEPVTAAMVKMIYDQLAAKPKKNTPDGRRQYVQMMRIVRDVLTEARGPEAVKNAYLEIRKRAGLNTADPLAKSIARELLFSVYKGRSDPFVLGGVELMKAKKMVEDGFPAKAEPWRSRLSVSRREGGNGTTERGIALYMELSAEAGTPLTREQIEAGFFRVNTKDGKAVAFAATKEDAEAAAKTVYERDMKGKKDEKPEPVRPNLDELKRENMPKRIDRDVTSEDFVSDLGFRGVEFGNWSAQDERQRILNMAYDGLMDLAEIMGVPPKAMSLNGTLGMAFGARGGGRFAAHYEPGKLVINMTKIRGGGSMAHEWAHAMDHYFGELDKQDAYTTQARGASGWYTEDQYKGVPRKRMERVGNEWKSVEKMRLDNLRPEMAAAFDEVMRALFQKQVTKAEMVRSHELDLERTEALAANEQDAGLKAMYQNAVANKRQALNELRNDPEGTLYAGNGRTDYANQAQALSGKSVDGYWVRPTEMFARAFESWVFDRVTAMGARSDYLVHGVEEDRFAGGGYKGNPYPTGEERARINAAFDKLAGTIQTKETDKGVAMFSRATESVPQSAAEWLSDTVIADEVEKRIGDFAQQPPIRIRDTAFGQLPGVARNDNVAGAVHDGAIYLFRDQLGDRAAVQRTLFHELFHFGLRKFLTKEQFTGQMMDLYRRDKAIKDEADRWAATADGLRAKELGGSEYALARGVDEALAILAEPNGGPHLNQTARAMFVRRVTNWLADVAQFLKMDKAAAYLRSLHNSEARAYIQSVFKRLESDAGRGGADWLESGGPAFSRASTAAMPSDGSAAGAGFNVDGSLSTMARSAAVTRAAGATDRAVMDMVREGKPARDILRLVAGTSKSRFNRQVARLLLKSGIAPAVRLEQTDLGSGDGFTFLAKYSRKHNALTLTPGAQAQAEHIVLHELMHAATLRALDRKGLASLQMRRLYEHVKRQGGAAGEYGMKNVGEFVAEAFTNPEFQRALRGITAPPGGTLKTAWDGFVRILRSILGLPQDAHDALSQALELGVAVMREDMALRQRGAQQRQAGDAFVQSQQTRSTYEGRIDALFNGGKAQRGTAVLDRSDVMGLLGHPDVPLMLNERHLLDGLATHPEMTAAAWKKVPGWLENPAAVFTDPNHPGRLMVIAPDRIAGYPVLMAVEPNPAPAERGKTDPFQLLVTVFAKTTGDLPALGYLGASGRLLYADTKKAPEVWRRAGGTPQAGRHPGPRAGDIPRTGGPTSGAKKILTEKHLNGWRKANLDADGKGADVDATGLARRVFNKINSVDQDLRAAKDDLVRNEVDVNKLRKKLGAPFEYQQEMAEKYAELKRLEAELKAEGQAPATPAATAITTDDTLTPQAEGESTNRLQTGAPEANTADVLYSSADATLPAKPLSLDRVNQLVQEAVAGIRGAPPVKVTANPADIGLKVPAGSVGYGVTLRSGDIYVFQSAMGSDLDVFQTVFHELFHRGVRVVVPKGQYVQAMLDLAKGDSRIQQLAIEWKNTEMGQKQKENLREQGYTGAELTGQYEALAIEEALAAVAEEIKAEGRLGSKPKNMTIRFLANWLAKLADLTGMKKLAAGIRAMTYNEAERFVMSVIDRSGEPVQAGRTDNLSAKQAAPAGDQTQTENFRRWFAGSKVVDADGKPLVVYHGTNYDFSVFQPNESGLIFLSPSAEEANGFTGSRGGATTNDGVLMPVYVRAIKPFDFEKKAHVDALMEALPYGSNLRRADVERGNWNAIEETHNVLPTIKRLGFDGVYVKENAKNIAVFRPEQIKSATGNNGNFDPNNPDIRYRSADLRGLKASAIDQLHQTMSHPGKVSLWDKTVGTMRHLGERAPIFKPVYEAAQRFIDDVSMLGNDAADRAPRLLPRVETLADLKKKPITAADNKAVGKPLFEGTLLWARDVDGTPVTTEKLNDKYRNATPDEKAQILLRTGKIQAQMLKVWRGLPVDQFNTIINNKFDSTILKPGVVWSAKELSELFGLNDQQVSLYQEARGAIDRSIDMTARADMLHMMGDGYASMREVVLEQASLQDAMALLTDTLQAEARENQDQADRLMKINNDVVKSYERAIALQEAGYAPLSRFGRYTVDVVSPDGTREYFGMFESMRDANLMAERMRGEFKGAAVTQGTMSDEAYKLFAGITPESLEQFGEMLGLKTDGDTAQDKAFQAYLQLSKNNHSALKRLIHRKGITGYSEDVGRVLASFVYSNARLAAGGLNAGTLEQAIQAIPKEQGELRDVAMGLRSYIQDPQEEGQAVRGMLFAQYLGGSVASAMVNMTQPFQITMPWLSQYGGMRKAAGQMARALKDMGTKGFKYEPDLEKALQDAVDDGTVSPQEIHQLMAQARGTGSLRAGDGTRMGDARAAVANNWERTKVAWGQPFALAEQFNRRSTFIAAYRTAKEQGMPAPAEFARRAVQETQFVYSKANKMRWGRGAIGGTMMTFKTYSVSYLELMHRMWTQGGPEGKRAVGWAVAMLMLMGGAGGLPFMEDAEDLIDGAGQLMGYNVSTKQWRKQLLRDTIGKELGDFVEQGVSGLPGAPIDVSGRLGMGNLVPGTGLLLSKQNRERDLMEVVGPAGDLVARGFTGARKALTGDLAGAALEVSPTAVRNAAKGLDMATSGIYKDTKGYKVIDTTLDEAISKAIGFQPRSVAEVQESNSFMQRSKSFYIQTSSDIKAQWAQALFNKDDAALERVRERLADWNRDNPDQPIVVKMPDVWKRVREMGKDRTQRIADTAPKALRNQMREMARENGYGRPA